MRFLSHILCDLDHDPEVNFIIFERRGLGPLEFLTLRLVHDELPAIGQFQLHYPALVPQVSVCSGKPRFLVLFLSLPHGGGALFCISPLFKIKEKLLIYGLFSFSLVGTE